MAVGTPAPNFLEVEFTPDTLFEGAATFDFFVDDQHGHRVAAAMTVAVQAPSNRPPVATDFAIDVFAGTSSVGRRFKERGFRVIANDRLAMCFTNSVAKIEVNSYPLT